MNVNLDLELYFGFGPALRICTAELILDLDSGHWTVFLGSEVFFFTLFFGWENITVSGCSSCLDLTLGWITCYTHVFHSFGNCSVY